MSIEEIKERVIKLVVHQLGVDEEEVISGATFIEDLGADSLDTVELMMAFEEEFQIDIPDKDANGIATVGEAIEYIKIKIAA